MQKGEHTIPLGEKTKSVLSQHEEDSKKIRKFSITAELYTGKITPFIIAHLNAPQVQGAGAEHPFGRVRKGVWGFQGRGQAFFFAQTVDVGVAVNHQRSQALVGFCSNRNR